MGGGGSDVPDVKTGEPAGDWAPARVDQRGVTAIVAGIGLTVLLGFAGAAVDVAYWLNATRGLQSAADQAAYSAAVAAGSGGCSGTTWEQQARAVAAARGYVNGQNATVAVTCRSSDASFTVQLDQDQPQWFTSLFLSSAPRATATATAQAASKASDLCVLALAGTNVDEGVIGTDASALWLNGNASAALHCGVAVNSNNNAALSTGGSSSLTATQVYLVGDMQGSPGGSSTIATTPTANNILKNQIPVADPYLGRAIPAYSSCGSYTMTTRASSGTINPGVFCGGLKIGGNSPSAIVLAPGIYYIVGGGLEFTSKVTVTSTGGVTFVLTGDSSHPTSGVTINGNANVILSAPTTGPTGGMLFFQDRNAAFTGRDQQQRQLRQRRQPEQDQRRQRPIADRRAVFPEPDGLLRREFVHDRCRQMHPDHCPANLVYRHLGHQAVLRRNRGRADNCRFAAADQIAQ